MEVLSTLAFQPIATAPFCMATELRPTAIPDAAALAASPMAMAVLSPELLAVEALAPLPMAMADAPPDMPALVAFAP